MSQKHKFWHPVRVRYVEVDSQRHVFFGHYLTYFDVALVEYLRAIGHSYSSMVSSGVDVLYVHADCDYHGRARFDDLLHVHARIGDFGNTSLTFEFAIYGQPADELIATGRIVAVAIDAETEELVSVPEPLREAVSRFEGQTVRGGGSQAHQDQDRHPDRQNQTLSMEER
jgi:acyl-CoA thioester hydrolase